MVRRASDTERYTPGHTQDIVVARITNNGNAHVELCSIRSLSVRQGLPAFSSLPQVRPRHLPPSRKQKLCWNSGPHVRTAIRRCHRIQWKRASVPTSARSVPRASIPFCTMSVLTVAVASFQDRSDHRKTGRAITISAKTRQVPKSNTGRLIRRHTRCSRQQLEPCLWRGGSR